jgi:hypothetical protein
VIWYFVRSTVTENYIGSRPDPTSLGCGGVWLGKDKIVNLMEKTKSVVNEQNVRNR